MHTNTLTIEVNVPIEELFKFVTEPWNTHMWLDDVKAEECDHWPAEVGVTRYRRKGADGHWTRYVLNTYEPNALFEMTREDGVHMVRYTLVALDHDRSEFVLHEWVSEGELEHPMPMAALYKLKQTLEIKV